MTTQLYADFHFHSLSSPDSVETLENHLISAKERGISQLCITDHWELVDEPPQLQPEIPTWLTRWQAAKATAPTGVSLYFGVEVGDGFANLEAVNQVLSAHPIDFVLGSVHTVNRQENPSIYYGFPKGSDRAAHLEFFDLYFQNLLTQSQQTYFDSLGHIIYPFRYLTGTVSLSPQDYMEEITAVLQSLIRGDKAFEVNTTQGKTIEIWTPILKRYKELGGTHLTLGSDAHQAPHLGLGLPEAVALLKSLGFDHYNVYHQRQAVAIPIV